MPYVIVVVIALFAGVGVGAYTIKQGTATAAPMWTERPKPDPASGARHATSDLPAAPTAQTRLLGAAGLAIAVLVGAGLIAGVCYVAWAAVHKAVS